MTATTITATCPECRRTVSAWRYRADQLKLRWHCVDPKFSTIPSKAVRCEGSNRVVIPTTTTKEPT